MARWQTLASLLNASGSIGIEVSTSIGQVDFEAKRKTGNNKTTLVVTRNSVSKDALARFDDLSYEEVQDVSIQEAIDMLVPYQLPQIEIVYGKPFI